MSICTRSIAFPCPILSEILAPFPKDFVVVNSLADPEVLSLILRHPRFPSGVETVTSEFSGASYERICKKRGGERKALVAFARRGVPSIFSKISAEKRLSLWIGLPTVEGEKCYNSYVLLDRGLPVFVHRKKYLFKRDEQGIIDTPPAFDGCLGGRTILICHEMQGFYDPVWKECRLPEARGKSRLLLVPAIWTANKKEVLKRIARTIVRKNRSPVDAMAIHADGSVALISDDNWAGVFGAVEKGRQKGASFAEIQKAGWIHLDRERKVINIVEAI